MVWQVIKTFGHDLGLSACFRQHSAEGHCKHLHGYALSFEFVFEADDLDAHHWVIDFGSLKNLKNRLVSNFDHRLCIAADDPHLKDFMVLAELHCANPIVFSTVGCESFARIAYQMAADEVNLAGLAQRVRVVSCKCSEHGANAAVYIWRDES